MKKTSHSISKSKACIFCDMVRGKTAESVVYRDDLSVAFLDHRPLLKGHCLLVPNSHFETLPDLPPSWVGPLFRNVQFLAKAVTRGLSADGSFIAVNTRISQSVPHLHVHIVPRWKKDGLFSKKLIWKRRPYANEAEKAGVLSAIRRSIEEIQSEAIDPREVE